MRITVQLVDCRMATFFVSSIAAVIEEGTEAPTCNILLHGNTTHFHVNESLESVLNRISNLYDAPIPS